MSNVREILMMNRFDAGGAPPSDEAMARRVARRVAAFGAASVLFYEEPIEMVRGRGVHLFDAKGRRYLDVYNNVPSVGHCHPRVVEAMARQAAELNIHTRYLNGVVETYADRLLASFPAPLTNVALTCTGSESNDLALRIARIATGRSGFVVTAAAYHGNTAAVTEISPSALRRGGLAPHVRAIPAPDIASGGDVGERFAADLTQAIADLARDGIGFAGLVVDTIFSSDGIHADPPGFLASALAVTKAAGGLFIADEVQPGFGRTGAGLWGFERHGIVPDIVTMGKPMGNGFPMGGVVTRPDLLRRFCEETGYFNTFGGNPVAAAAGLAVLDVIRDEGLVENAGRVGASFKAGLCDLAGRHATIGAVRGAGLFIGLDLVEPESGEPDPALCSRLINGLKTRGILIGAAGLYGNTLKIRPPLCFGEEHAGIFVESFQAALDEATGTR
ncbi:MULTISPECIES: aspartate aminotransferase family protein [unclassified Aureimonas]|uniref:aspartate aminotransferase family protein n=1 Tax=unclassified Aureimonas TaxID=2615206 RepID=UPI0006FEB877|nr:MULTISPECIES: aspartate aminotransferase family protein [unclassified Aureimonas]KQT69825.1 4-aminobutyrate aminotransferase [Aureimonas sp. Leaf427]KQT76023.1 4-aminobutyrate aminotransferase [Aureimonas sp. Leaf460]